MNKCFFKFARIFAGFFLLSFTFPSCLYKKNLIRHEGSAEKFSPKNAPSLCIEMPDNKLVFENVSALVYDALWNHFDRVGYRLVDKSEAEFSLLVTIKDISSAYKFLSPDLLTYGEKVKMTLLGILSDAGGKVVAKKVFMWTTLISKAKDYVENSAFSDFEYSRLLEQKMYKLDHYFRSFLHKRKQL